MKYRARIGLLSVFCMLAAASVPFSEALADTASRGYLYQTRGNSVAYAGITDSGEVESFDLNYALNMGSLSEEQHEAMKSCMSEKDSKAILLVRSTERVQIPAENGRTTFFHRSVTKSVECVSAPGFLQFWRTRIGN